MLSCCFRDVIRCALFSLLLIRRFRFENSEMNFVTVRFRTKHDHLHFSFESKMNNNDISFSKNKVLFKRKEKLLHSFLFFFLPFSTFCTYFSFFFFEKLIVWWYIILFIYLSYRKRRVKHRFKRRNNKKHDFDWNRGCVSTILSL